MISKYYTERNNNAHDVLLGEKKWNKILTGTDR